ncbi:right-handed parallel beta-helix repeat-containing protein [Protaetiibacter larvae]|uniref:Plasmid stabilization protein n=1 Tax=Protaetiibacter larvae TaxID=2592654 RepID=A0A5C1Y8G3_9MICO|nr:right-handed parallel beta-helix repeat-containing protein [Protaetiibacter larvae]QEO09242.1 plasmid stabilization protein [Protaetiibacter larvae]
MPRRLAAAALAALAALALCGCADAAPATKAEVHVPADAATLSAAMELVSPGGLVVIAPGRYEEQLLVDKADVTVRGEDRNATVIDGGGIRPYGIVAIADGVRIENLTVTGATFYGVLVTGLHDGDGPADPGEGGYTDWDPRAFPPLQRFLVDHVTAFNNGLYGIYAFNSQHGVIRDSYASGSADSGFYVGQCEECDILVTGNVAERNAVGFENANASDSVVIVGNRFAGNRVGMTLLSSYQEAFTPQRANTVVGNLVTDNVEPDSPSQAEGGFATGIGIAGGQRNTIERNRITGNPRAAVILTNTEDIAASGNRVEANLVDDGARLANLSAARTPAVGNCWTDAAPSRPAELAAEAAAACDGDTTPQSATTALPGPEAPPGVSFRRVAAPRDQPQLAASGRPARLPGTVAMPELTGVAVPDATLLADRAGTR